MKTIYTTCFLTLAALQSYPQMFRNVYGWNGTSEVISVVEADSSYFLIGNCTDAGNQDIFMVRVEDTLGHILDKMKYSLPGSDYVATAFLNSDTNIVIFGGTNSSGTGGTDLLLMEVDLSGNILWQKTYGDTTNDDAVNIIVLRDGNYLLLGSVEKDLFIDQDILLVKVTPAGAIIWQKELVGEKYDIGNAVIETADSSLYIAGSSNSDSTVNTDGLLVKTDSSGNVLFSIGIGGSNVDYFEDLALDFYKDHLVLFGTTNSFGAISNDAYVVKSRLDGIPLWGKRFGGGSGAEYGRQVSAARKEFFYGGSSSTFGAAGSELIYAKSDTNGIVSAMNAFGGAGSDEFKGYSTATGGGLILNGSTESFEIPRKSGLVIKGDAMGGGGCAETSIYPAVNTALSDTNVINITSSAASLISANGTFAKSAVAFSVDSLGFPFAAFSYTTFLGLATFTDESTRDPLDTIIWHFGDTSAPDTFSIFVSHLYDTGTYKACLEVWNSCGWDSVCKMITITAPIDTNDTTTVVRLLHKNGELKLSVLPNPASALVYLIMESPEPAEIKVEFMSYIGTPVRTVRIPVNGRRLTGIDVSDLARGIYIVKASVSGLNAIGKLVLVE